MMDTDGRVAADEPMTAESALDASRQPEPEVSAAQFEPLGGAQAATGAASLDMLGDVTIQVCLELGRARLTVADVLSLKVGSVVELDKLAGEPGDLYVNGSMIGRGEIVVVDDHFGIRVFDAVDQRSM
jgi:flagellar motor switch protein FliN/FliY